MIEIGYIIIGAVVGVASVLAAQELFNWIADLKKEVQQLRFDRDNLRLKITREGQNFNKYIIWLEQQENK